MWNLIECGPFCIDKNSFFPIAQILLPQTADPTEEQCYQSVRNEFVQRCIDSLCNSDITKLVVLFTGDF